ncbi:dopey domain containing protein [Entamoeba histolytica HM-1:IMSS-A]|nr:dopey domain containing protein [Entamoeba histolytica HM-1:IMSS-A]
MVIFYKEYSQNIFEEALTDLFEYSKKNGILNIISVYEELLGKQILGEQIIHKVTEDILCLLQLKEETGQRKDVDLLAEFLKNMNCKILFENIINLISNDKEYAIKRTLSFINTYHGDEKQMEEMKEFKIKVVCSVLNKLSEIVEKNGLIERVKECYDLIELCLKDKLEETEEKDIELLKITIQSNKVFEMFMKNYIAKDDRITETKLKLFTEFCNIMKLLHAEITPFKRYQIQNNNEESNEENEKEEEIGIEGIQILLKKELNNNGWIDELKRLISQHPNAVLRARAAKCYYDIWKKEEKDVLQLDDETFIYELYQVLWKILDEDNYSILTDVVLFFHTIGIAHPQLTYDFITEKLKDGNEDDLLKYMLFWKNSTVLVYDIENSVFNRALLLFLRFYNHQSCDPYFLDFIQCSFNVETIGRVVLPILIPLYIPLEKRTKYCNFEVNDDLLLTHLNMIETLFSCIDNKMIEALEGAIVPKYLLNKYKEINPQIEQLPEPNNLLLFIITTLMIYLKANKKIVNNSNKNVIFKYQSLITDILINIFTNYQENQTIKKIGISIQYTVLSSFAESITSSPKLQLHLLSLVKLLMKVSDITHPDECITRYPLFIQTLISGISQEKNIYRQHFLRMIDDCVSYIPSTEYKTSVVLLIQALSTILNQMCSIISPQILLLCDEVSPIIDIQRKLFEYSLNLFPYKSLYEENSNPQSQQVSAGQQIGNAVLFVPMLVVSVFFDVKGTKEKQPIQKYFLTSTIKQIILTYFDLYEFCMKATNLFLIQTNCVAFIEKVFNTFPLEFVSNYLIITNEFSDEHISLFKSFDKESIVKMLWSLLVISETNMFLEIPRKQILNFLQILISKIISPIEIYRTQMYIQSIINCYINNDELIFSNIHTIKVFLDSMNQNDVKLQTKLETGWQELITNVLNKFMLFIHQWKENNQTIKINQKRKSISSVLSTPEHLSESSEGKTPRTSEVNESKTPSKNSEESEPNIVNNELLINSDVINIVTNDIIPIISFVFDDSSISTMIDLGKQFENNLLHPCNDMGINIASLNVLIELAKRNQLTNKWSKLVINVFTNEDFFTKSPTLLNLWKIPIYSVYTTNGARLLFDMINSIGKSGQLFTTKENEIPTRAKIFKRVAFLLLSGENEVFDTFMDQNQLLVEILLDKLIDTIKQYPCTQIYINGLLLLKVMLLKCSFTRLKKRMPTILNELITIFNLPFDKDPMIILSGLQLFDMLQIIPECSVDIYSWIFFLPYSPDDLIKSKFKPLIPVLTLKSEVDCSVDKPDITYNGLTQLRELIVKDKFINDMQEYQILRMKLSYYTKDLYRMTSRSDNTNFDSVARDIMETFLK